VINYPVIKCQGIVAKRLNVNNRASDLLPA